MAAFTAGNGPDLQILRDLAKDELKQKMGSLGGRKDLVIDPGLMRPFDRIAGLKFLKDNSVDKIYKLDDSKLPQANNRTRLYFVRPFAYNMQLIANHINSDSTTEGDLKQKSVVVMVPRRMYDCELLLEREGVIGRVVLDEFKLDLIPLDTDLLSLEIPNVFKTLFLHQSQTWIHTIAYSLWNLQSLFGIIPYTFGQGRYANMVKDLFGVLCDEIGKPKILNNEIEYLFLFDRDIDYISVLLTQLTYEGLVDETFGIESSVVEFDSEVTGTDKKVSVLTSQDETFELIRNRHISDVFHFLSNKVKVLQTDYEKRHNLTTIESMKQFVSQDLKKLKQQHKGLGIHIGACESILNKKRKINYETQLATEHSILEGSETRGNIDYIEESINKQNCLKLNFRLLCLLSCTQGGLEQRDYRNLKTQFLQSYGYNHLISFFNLKKMGLLTEQESIGILPSSAAKFQDKVAAAMPVLQRRSNFLNIVKKLDLIPKSEGQNMNTPANMSYVFGNAYIPLICRLVEEILKKDSLQGLTDVIKLLPQPTISHIEAKSAKGSSLKSTVKPVTTIPVVLVYFIGGCTFAEIAALRFLGLQKGYRFIIATTNIINGNKLMDLVFEEMK